MTSATSYSTTGSTSSSSSSTSTHKDEVSSDNVIKGMTKEESKQRSEALIRELETTTRASDILSRITLTKTPYVGVES